MCCFDFISDNTLYYFFSTIAQVLAATIALISIVLQFRINSIKKFLLGDGQALYKRWEDGEPGYKKNDKKLKQLRDAIYREDYNGIQKTIEFLAEEDDSQNSNGFNGLRNKFSIKRQEIIDLKTSIIDVVKLSVITIVISLIMLSIIDIIKQILFLDLVSIIVVLILSIVTLYKTYKGFKLGID